MVTAIVSAYYADKYLKGRLENLLSQSLKPEVIVLCHEDSEEEKIAKEFDVKMIIIPKNKPVPTVYEAWNEMITHATGEYITNANCDDRLYPKALEKLAKALDNHRDYGIAYFNVDIVTEIGGVPTGQFLWLEGGLKELLYKGCFLGPMPMWRKSLHDKYGYFEAEQTLANGETYKPKIVSDYEFWMRLAAGGEKFYHIKQVLGAYLKRDDSIEHKEKLRHTWERARARAKYKEDICFNI